jgi:hypothetical protein
LNGVQTIQMKWRSNHSNEMALKPFKYEPSFLALLSSSEPSFEYSIAEEYLLI